MQHIGGKDTALDVRHPVSVEIGVQDHRDQSGVRGGVGDQYETASSDAVMRVEEIAEDGRGILNRKSPTDDGVSGGSPGEGLGAQRSTRCGRVLLREQRDDLTDFIGDSEDHDKEKRSDKGFAKSGVGKNVPISGGGNGDSDKVKTIAKMVN